MTKDQLKNLVKDYFNLTEIPTVEEPTAEVETVVEEITVEETPETFEAEVELVEEELPTEELPVEEEIEVTEEPSMEDVVAEIMNIVKAEVDALKAEIEMIKDEIDTLKAAQTTMSEKYELISSEPASERTIPTAAKIDSQTFEKENILNKDRFAMALEMVKTKNK